MAVVQRVTAIDRSRTRHARVRNELSLARGFSRFSSLREEGFVLLQRSDRLLVSVLGFPVLRCVLIEDGEFCAYSRESGTPVSFAFPTGQDCAVVVSTVRRALISRIGGWPKKRLYSRLNWLALS